MIERADDGWFIERNGRYVHLTEQWLEEMRRHQVTTGRKSAQAWNQLYYAFHTAKDPDVVYAKWEAFYDSTGSYTPPEPAPPSPFQEFIARQRETG